MADGAVHDRIKRAGYTLTTQDKTIPMNEFIDDYVRIFVVGVCCALCENYGIRWSCPPFTFATIEFWHRYKKIKLTARILTPEPGADDSTLLDAMEREKNTLLEELLEQESNQPGSLALSAGSCTLCGEHCSRSDNRPCRQQNKLRYSIEALGGDVAKISEQCFDKPLQWVARGKTPDYLMLIGALLLK